MNIGKYFGKDTAKVIGICTQMCDAWCFNNNNGVPELKKKLFGIAKRHHVHIDWCGDGTCAPMGDKFILYKNGKRVDTFYYNGTFEHISF